DVSMFNHLYDMNLEYFRELTMYIIAGEKRLKEVRETDLVTLKDKAKQSGDTLDAQKASDLEQAADRFEKKLHDLKLTRQISLQMAPQIRLLQNNNSLLIERIQSTLVNTLPLWKNQMVLALGMEHSRQAMQAQRAVTDMTNELLKKNAEALKQGTIETATEAERGIIDIQTLVETNKSLIDTMNEVVRIQTEGRQKRAEAEKTLRRMEDELKNRLING
ncbi:MAG TPA: toxic anion resistance protein, partial [Clostridia bacterium]|nr:toxic anion resistance protein [Clostridia bacterium]